MKSIMHLAEMCLIENKVIPFLFIDWFELLTEKSFNLNLISIIRGYLNHANNKKRGIRIIGVLSVTLQNYILTSISSLIPN